MTEDKNKFAMRMFGTASAFAMSMMLVSPAYAQDAGTPPQEEEDGTDQPVEEEDDSIVITGFLRSLETAQDIKREADTFVDVITAEDIGALPDRSVAESLQRVPGVNISRFVQRDDPDRFSVEGSGVIIRGLPYVRSELNGRDIFSADGGRTLGFNDVSPELLGRVEVFKNLTADMIEGGISGTVNLVTRKPLNSPGFKLAGTVEANVGDLAEEWSPGFSVLASNTFETRFGTFGIQGAYAQQELITRTDASQITDPCYRADTLDGPCLRAAFTDSGGVAGDGVLGPDQFPPANSIIAPKGAGVRTTTIGRDRRAYSAVGQFESWDGRLLATLEYLRAESDSDTSEFATLALVNNPENFPVIVDGTTPIIENGQLVSAYYTQASLEGSLRVPGIPTELLRLDTVSEAMTEDVSFDLDYEFTDRLRSNIEAQWVNSNRNDDGVIVAMRTFSDIYFDNRGETPVVQFFEVGQAAGEVPVSSASDDERTFYWFHLDGRVRNNGDLFSLKNDWEYDISDNGFLRQAKFGARWAERNRTTRAATYQVWSNLGDTWTSRNGDWSWGQNNRDRFYGEGGGAYVVDFPEYANLYDPFGDNFQRGAVDQPIGPAYFFGPEDLVGLYLSGEAEDQFNEIKDFTLTQERRDTIQTDDQGRPIFNEGQISQVRENTLAGYARFDYGTEFSNGWVLDGNFGVRYARTRVISDGQVAFPEASTLDAPNVINGVNFGGDGDGVVELEDILNRCENVPEGQTQGGFCDLEGARLDEFIAAFNGAVVPDDADIEYDDWLPSFNARLDLGDGFIIRGAASKGIFRPDLASYRTGGFVGDNTRVLFDSERLLTGPLFAINTGNRLLRPTTAWNYDLSFEWYWDTVGSLTVTGFLKQIDDVVALGAEERNFTNPITGIDYNFRFDSVYNLESGTLKGVEIAYQQVYDFLPGPLDGLGTQLTYTYVDGGEFRNSEAGAQQSPFAQDLTLAGISEHTINAVAFYEKGPISARAAYNWRSDFLQTPRDVIFPFSPIYGEATGQLDASLFFSVSDNLKLGVQGVNLLDEVTRTTQLIDYDGTRATRSAFRNDRRFTFLARFDF